MWTRAEGFEAVETTFSLVYGVRRIDVTVRLPKQATTEKESVHVVFPFAARDPAVAYELTGGVGGGSCVPGAAAHVHAIRHWVALQDAAVTVAWGTLRCRSSNSETSSSHIRPTRGRSTAREAGWCVSWVTNNVWDRSELPAHAGGRDSLRLRGRVGRAGRGCPSARDRDRRRAHPPARRRAGRDRARRGRLGVRARRARRRGRDARALRRWRQRAPAVVRDRRRR